MPNIFKNVLFWIGVVLITLQLAGIMNISWWLVLSPIILLFAGLPLFLALLMFLAVFVAVFFILLTNDKSEDYLNTFKDQFKW